MTVQKLSQIATSPSNLAATDFLVGVTAGNVDYRFSPAQIGAASDIIVNTTPIIGGSSSWVLYDNSGTVGAASKFTINVDGNPVCASNRPFLQFNDLETNGVAWDIGAEVKGTTPVFYLFDFNDDKTDFAANLDGGGSFTLRSISAFAWTNNAAFADVGTIDTGTSRLAANSIAFGNGTPGDTSGTITAAFGNLRNSTSPSEFKVFNTWATGWTDFEAGIFDWTTNSNILTIGTQAGGTGTARDILMAPASGLLRVPNGSVIAGNGPGIAFPVNTATGFAANINNLAVWESGTIALNLSTAITQFRIPSNFSFSWSSATNNNSAADTFLSRVGVGTIQTGNITQASSANTLVCGNGSVNSSSGGPSITFLGDLTSGLAALTGNFAFWEGGNVILNLSTSGLNIRAASNVSFAWDSATTNNTGSDTGLARNAAGTVEANNGTAGNFGFMKAKLQTSTNSTTGLAPGVLAASTNADITIYDASGQAYRVPCII